MRNIKKQHWAFCIIFCVFFLFIFSCAPEAGVEKKVEALLKANDYTSALELLNEGIKQYPEKPSLRALKTKVLARLGKFIEATEEYFRFYKFTEKHDPKLLYEIALSAWMAYCEGYYEDEYSKIYASKYGVALTLAEVGDKDGVSTLREGLEDYHNLGPGLQNAVALASLGDKSGIDILKEAFNSNNEWARRSATVALANLGNKSGIDILKKYLEDGNLWSAAALANLGDKSGIDILKKNLEDGNFYSAAALARLGDKSGIDFLKKALEDKREKWIEAAKTLARVGDKSIIPVLTNRLKEMYKNGEPDSCTSLILSLYKLTK